MKAWSRYFDGPVVLARPLLLMRGALLLLAFDAWVLMTERGGRYGAGGFNVAHFAWLDALQPLPTPTLYVGTVCLTGLLAFVCAFTPISRILLSVTLLLYTYSWASSMLDSYQHHYFVSLLLVCFVCYPRVGTHETGPAPAYLVTLVTVAIVYAFTGISKLDVEWRSGQSLAGIPAAAELMRPLVAALASWGVTPRVSGSIVGWSVVVVQFTIATAYLVTRMQDDGAHRTFARVMSLAGLTLALSFHTGAEIIDLRIGWFSYYMMFIACCAFAPHASLRALARHGARWAAWTNRLEKAMPKALPQIAVPTFASATLVLLSTLVDLPGVAVAGALGAAMLLFASLLQVNRRRPAFAVYPYAWAVVGASLSMWLAIAGSGVRFDFYRYVGGDALRRGDLVTALHAYRKANQYAKKGERRDEKVRQIERLLGERYAPD